MEIKKADSKGRVSGFIPETHYKIRKMGDERMILEPIWDEVDRIPAPAPKPALDYLESFGLDYNRVNRHRANEWGYDEMELDEKGNRVYEYGAVKQFRKPWPEGFDWGTFLTLATTS